MLLRKSNGAGSEFFYRVILYVIIAISLLLIILDRISFRSNLGYFALITTVFAVFIGLSLKASSKDKPVASKLLLFVSLYWSVILAFFVPVISLVMVITIFLSLLASLYARSYYRSIISLILIVGVEVGYVLDDIHTSGRFVLIVSHFVSLTLIAIVGYKLSSSNDSESNDTSNQMQKAKLERERLQALINSMTDGVLATDTSGNVEVYNGSILDILNSNVSLNNQNITKHLKINNADGTEVDYFSLAKKQQGYLVSRDFLLPQSETDNINIYISISPVKIGYGREDSDGYIFLLRDITREKSLEEERDEFVSVVSHELRTPVTIAEGNLSNAELLSKKEKTPDSIVKSLDEAHKQIIFLSDMINDLATLSRAEQGKLQAAPEDIDIHELVKSLQRDYRMSAQQKGLEFSSHVGREVVSIFSSRLYVREILQNFITNSIKYTEEGAVKLDITMKGTSVQFAVSDTGIGISNTDQKHVFKKFFRSEDYRTRENSGTGLGLYVTMKLAKLVNAQIKVSSELNEGSTFTIIVPPMQRPSH